MQRKIRWGLVSVGLLATLGLGLIAACTESSDSPMGAGGTSSGGAGGTGGGITGTGGTAGGGTGGMAGGGTGGMAGTAGSAGTAGAGGTDTATPRPVPGAEGFNCDPPSGDLPALTLTTVASGFVDPLLVTYAPGRSDVLYVVEQAGQILVVENGTTLEEPFLDLSGQVMRDGNEQGLLGLAFHPDFAENHRVFVNYSADAGVHDLAGGSTVVSEFIAADDGNSADLATERVLLTVPQPYSNHNGGMLAFGSDGFLYVGFGDGGSGGDPQGHGQNIDTLLGSLARIDVDADDAGPYGIPAGNLEGGAPEIWDYGLRNPWRFSFDGCTGALYIGDVGQDAREEVNVVPAGQGQNNYGWKLMEGINCSTDDCDDFTAPVADYGRGLGNSVTGGFVYRGSAIPALRGTYFYGDYASGLIWAFEYEGGEAANHREVTATLGSSGAELTSFGQDADGEVYIVRRTGQIQRIDPQ